MKTNKITLAIGALSAVTIPALGNPALAMAQDVTPETVAVAETETTDTEVEITDQSDINTEVETLDMPAVEETIDTMATEDNNIDVEAFTEAYQTWEENLNTAQENVTQAQTDLYQAEMDLVQVTEQYEVAQQETQAAEQRYDNIVEDVNEYVAEQEAAHAETLAPVAENVEVAQTQVNEAQAQVDVNVQTVEQAEQKVQQAQQDIQKAQADVNAYTKAIETYDNQVVKLTQENTQLAQQISRAEAQQDAPLTQDQKLRLAEEIFMEMTNEYRKANNLEPIKSHDLYNSQALKWSEKMASDRKIMSPNEDWGDAFRHSNANEWGRSGENIAGNYYGSSMSSQDIADMFFQQWRNSPGHNANLLNRSYTGQGAGFHIDEANRMWATHMFFNDKVTYENGAFYTEDRMTKEAKKSVKDFFMPSGFLNQDNENWVAPTDTLNVNKADLNYDGYRDGRAQFKKLNENVAYGAGSLVVKKTATLNVDDLRAKINANSVRVESLENDKVKAAQGRDAAVARVAYAQEVFNVASRDYGVAKRSLDSAREDLVKAEDFLAQVQAEYDALVKELGVLPDELRGLIEEAEALVGEKRAVEAELLVQVREAEDNVVKAREAVGVAQAELGRVNNEVPSLLDFVRDLHVGVGEDADSSESAAEGSSESSSDADETVVDNLETIVNKIQDKATDTVETVSAPARGVLGMLKETGKAPVEIVQSADKAETAVGIDGSSDEAIAAAKDVDAGTAYAVKQFVKQSPSNGDLLAKTGVVGVSGLALAGLISMAGGAAIARRRS